MMIDKHETANGGREPRTGAPFSVRLIVAGLVAFTVAAVINWGVIVSRVSYAIRSDEQRLPMPTPDALRIAVPPDTLWIPSIGVEAPIIYVERREETAYQEALGRGVGHFPGTAVPGETGNVYIFGHSSDFAWSDGDYKTVFALLTELRPGDIVKASDHEGTMHSYAVTGTAVVDPGDLSVISPDGSDEKRMLTLQTSFPLGTALKRFVVTAELIPTTASQQQEERGESYDE